MAVKILVQVLKKCWYFPDYNMHLSWPSISVPCTVCLLQKWTERYDTIGGRARSYFSDNWVFENMATIVSFLQNSVTELYCSYLINSWYYICQSAIKWKKEALFLWRDAKCVFSVINAFIVSGLNDTDLATAETSETPLRMRMSITGLTSEGQMMTLKESFGGWIHWILGRIAKIFLELDRDKDHIPFH